MRSRKLTMLIFMLTLILITTGCTSNNSSQSGPISRTEFLMDTVITVKIFDKYDEKILDEVFEKLVDLENKMSFTIEDSEVSRINENAGIEPITVSPETYYVLGEAKYYAEISSGAYDPTIGPLVDLWDVKSEEIERDWIPTPEEISISKSLTSYENLQLLDNNRVMLKEKDMRINLGGIVKGYATDEVRKILIDNGVESAIIDLGGNVFAHGFKNGNTLWSIGMQNPLEYTGNYLGILSVSDKSIVTSGDYERYFIYEGEKYHHILDTGTGYPVDNEITGVTIVSDKSIDGDGLSTSLFALGLDKGIELVNTLENVDAIFITKDQTIHVSKNLLGSFKLREGLTSFNLKEY